MGSTEDMKNRDNGIISTALVKHMKPWRSIAVLSLVLGCGVASAANPRATDTAFAALFSMPTATPSEGKWIFPPEDDFTVRTEAGLIAYLREQKNKGRTLTRIATRELSCITQSAHACRPRRAGFLKTAAIRILKCGTDTKTLYSSV